VRAARPDAISLKEEIAMMRPSAKGWALGVAAAGLVCMAGCGSTGTQGGVSERCRPRLLADLPDTCNTPDGMRLNPKTGDVIVACPNFNEKNYPGLLIKITPANKWEVYCDTLPKHPETGYACPMGMDFGPDGNLYYADNQYFYNKDHKSRLMRVVIQNNKPVRVEEAVVGFKLSNAVMFKGNDVYVSDTFFDLKDKPGVSGVYRIGLDEMKRGIVKLLPKEQHAKDPHCIATFQTQPLEHRKGDLAGADGVTFDAEGNLYTGNFGDGVLSKVCFNADGSVKSNTIFVKNPVMTCVDGIFFDAKRNCIYVADSEKNAIQVVHLPDGRVTTLWENGDTDGTDGLLDQPCEPLVRGEELIVVNFDMPFPGLRNSKYNKPHTISVIQLRK
jgi:DNA-binding beta-propeller fold protein YncE